MKHLETYQERRLRFACHCGDVRQFGAPLACGASVSRFNPDTSHWLTPFAYRLSEQKTSITFKITYGPCWAPLSKAIASCLSDMLILEGLGCTVTVRLKSYRINLVANENYYYVDITVYNDNPNVLSDKTFPELFEAMQNYEIVKVDHDGLWSDFIYLGMTDNVQWPKTHTLFD